MISEILGKYNKQLEQEDICPKFDLEHDYESIHTFQISKNVIEVEYICLEYGNLKYIYNYVEDSL
jgi:hypothetical protein